MIVKFVLIHAILSLGLCKVINNELEERLSAIEKVIKEKDEIIEGISHILRSTFFGLLYPHPPSM